MALRYLRECLCFNQPMDTVDTVCGDIRSYTSIGVALTFLGKMHGDAIVTAGGIFILHGLVCGDLIVDREGVARIHGTISGSVFNLGGNLDILGTVQGNIYKEGGTTSIAAAANIGGR